MSNYKRQHFIPLKHLKRFSSDSGNHAYTLIDGKWIACSLKRQCQSSFYFSRDEPEVSEKELQEREILFESISEIVDGHNYVLPYISLLIDLHFRSNIYKHDESYSERREQNLKLFLNFAPDAMIKQLHYKETTNSIIETAYAFQCSWKFKKIMINSNTLITSDLPVMLLGFDGEISIIIFNYSPQLSIVAYNYLTIEDIEPVNPLCVFSQRLNTLTALYAHKNIYSPRIFDMPSTRVLHSALSSKVNEQKKWHCNQTSISVQPRIAIINSSNTIFTIKRTKDKFEVMPYSKAAEFLNKGSIKIDFNIKQVTINTSINTYELFCVMQLAQLRRMNEYAQQVDAPADNQMQFCSGDSAKMI